MAEMQKMKVEVVRYNPEVDAAPHSAFYEVPYDEQTSLLDALGYIKDNLAPDLSYRWSCRMAICGSCGMMVNKVPKLACKTFLREYTKGIKVEALGNFPIERDLVVDMTHFIESLEAIKPYIIGNPRTPDQGPNTQTPAQMAKYHQFSGCINCGLCVDACDSVMDKVQLPRGLIRFATQNGMENRWNQAQMLRRMLRPQVLIYTAITLAFCVGLAMSLAQRTPLKVNVIRDRASLARIVPGGQLENLYRLQVMNATEAPQHYRISATGLEGLTVAKEDRQLALAPTQSQWITVRARIPYGSAAPGAHTMAFIVSTEGQEPIAVREPSVFQVPNER